MELAPLAGKPVRIPPGRVEVHLNADHRRTYRALYARYRTVTDGLPILRDRDFDGRPVNIAPNQLEALNRAFATLGEPLDSTSGVFDAQERQKTRLFKRLQFLS
jgi:hypothetical protein